MATMIALAVLLLAAGVYSGRSLLREGHARSPGRGRRLGQAAARTAALLALGAQFGMVALDLRNVIAVVVVPLLLGVSLLMWLVLEAAGRFIARHDGTTLRGTAVLVLRDRASTLGPRLRKIGTIVLPSDWSEVDIRRLAPDAVLSFRSSASVYALMVVMAPLLAILALIATMHFEDTADSELVSVVVGFNVLLAASCLAVTAMVTVGLVAVLHVLRVLRCGVSYRRALTTIAAVTGLCSAIGALAGALLPVVTTTPGLDGMFPPESAAGLTSPAVLVELSAGGAVLGFALGLVVAMHDLCREAKNFVLRRFAVPAVFLLVLWAGPRVGVSPSAVGARIINSYRDVHGASSVACTDAAPPDLLMDQGRLFEAIDRCGGSLILPNGWLWGITCALCVVLFLVRTWGDVSTAAPERT